MTRYTPLWEQAGSYAASVDRRLISSLWPLPASSGCALTAVAGTMQVNIAAGMVAVPSQNSTGSTLCVSDAVETVTFTAAPPSGQNRIDLITCHPRATDLDGGSNNDFIFDIVAGTPAASPVVPALPAGQVLLGQVLVPGGSAAVTQANITDLRPSGLLLPRGYITSLTGPAATVSAGGSLTTVLSLPTPVVVGRRYRVSGFGRGQQLTAQSTGSTQILIQDDQGGSANLALVTTPPANTYVFGSGVYLYVPTATKTATLTLQGATPAGSLSFAANQSFLMVEDIGGT